MAQTYLQRAAELERASADLDRLIADVRLGPPSHRQYDEQEARAQRIGSAIVAPYRGAGAKPATSQ